MHTARLNITLPSDLVKDMADIPNKSAFIAESIRQRIARERKESIEKSLRAAYMASTEEDKKISSEWDTTTGDGIV